MSDNSGRAAFPVRGRFCFTAFLAAPVFTPQGARQLAGQSLAGRCSGSPEFWRARVLTMRACFHYGAQLPTKGRAEHLRGDVGVAFGLQLLLQVANGGEATGAREFESAFENRGVLAH